MLDLYRAGEPEASEALCRELVFAADPPVEALVMAGVFDARRAEYAEAADWFGRAAAADPDRPGTFVNLGQAQDALGLYLEAVTSYRRAIALGAASAHLQVRLGSALQRLGRFDEALEAVDAALALEPDDIDALYERTDLLLALGRDEEAVATLEHARTRGADPQRVDYALAALGRAPTVAASPPDYVRDLFDGYADRFDGHLVGHLRYAVPERIEEALDRLGTGTGLDVLDAGCGTGLCGAALRRHARRLEGVDLAPRMLEHARRRGCYDVLHCAELAAFARERPQAYDLVVAADVLIYFGDLGPVLEALHTTLRPGGRLLFSIERSEGEAVVLNRSRRFAHSLDHVRAAAAGWQVEATEPFVLRRERGADVAGCLVVLRR